MTNAEQTAAIEEMQQQIAALQAENASLAVQIDIINQRIAPIAPMLPEQPDYNGGFVTPASDGDAQ
jgi:hypothetical protein